MEDDIYPTEREYKNTIKRVQKLDKENKESLERFIDDCLADGLTKRRIVKLAGILMTIIQMIENPLEKLTKQDIKKLVAKIEGSDKAEWTKADYKGVIKKFFKWSKGTDEYPEEVKWIKSRCKNGKKLPEEMLNEEDVKKLIESCQNSRDRALISILADGGLRIGEALSLKRKHIQIGEKEAVIIIPQGKTGARRVLLIPSVPYLTTWLEDYQSKNPEDWLWVKLKDNNQRLNYGSARMLLNKIAKRSGVKKRVHLHGLRHCAATNCASFLTDSQMMERFGWTKRETVTIYTHLTGRDVDNAYKKQYGINTKEEEKEKSKLLPINCPTCKTVNPPTANYCCKCRRPMNLKVAIGEREVWEETDMVMAMIMEELRARNEELVQEVAKKVKERLQGKLHLS